MLYLLKQKVLLFEASATSQLTLNVSKIKQWLIYYIYQEQIDSRGIINTYPKTC